MTGDDHSGIGTLNRRSASPRSISASITWSPIGPWTSSGRTIAARDRPAASRNLGSSTLVAPVGARIARMPRTSIRDAVDVDFDGGEREEPAGPQRRHREHSDSNRARPGFGKLHAIHSAMFSLLEPARVRMPGEKGAARQLRPLAGLFYVIMPGRDDVPRPTHRMSRVDRHYLAVDQPIEQVPQSGEALLDRGRRQLARRRLDPGRHVHRLDIGDRLHAGARAPAQEFLRRAVVGPPGVRVADVGGKEFEEADRGALAGGGKVGEVIGTS